MKLDSFRELLIKKTRDSSLENLISFVHDEVLADIVLESLEKMARAKHKGDAANVPIRDFGVEMDPELEPEMLRGALGHHISHYKAALRDGRKDLANDHARQVFRLVDMADQAQKHSQGKLHVEAVSPHPWERNAKARQFTAEDKPVLAGNKKPGQFVTDTKGWRHRGSDYGFLQQAPHESYSNEVRKHGHNKAYPLEQIRVNGKYVDVKDVPTQDLKGYEEHEFDKHPIMNHFEKPTSQRSPEDDTRWRTEHEAYQSSPHIDKHFEKQAASEAADPEAHAKSGSAPSMPVHADVAGLNPKIDTPATSSAAPVAAPTADHRSAIMSANLPDHIKAKLLEKLK
jgi:hypothetical protein